MTDIVEQLRWCGLGFPKFKTNRGDYGICDDAADEIERLRKALREIHGLGDTPDDSWKAYLICCKALGEDE
jgi:hypothetical protein